MISGTDRPRHHDRMAVPRAAKDDWTVQGLLLRHLLLDRRREIGQIAHARVFEIGAETRQAEGVLNADAGFARRNALQIVVHDGDDAGVSRIDDALGLRLDLQFVDLQEGVRLLPIARLAALDIGRAPEDRPFAVGALLEPEVRLLKRVAIGDLRQGRRRAEFPASQFTMDRIHGRVTSWTHARLLSTADPYARRWRPRRAIGGAAAFSGMGDPAGSSDGSVRVSARAFGRLRSAD
jgi:hypothetical protein